MNRTSVTTMAVLVVALGGLAQAKCDLAEWEISLVSADTPTSALPFESSGYIEEYDYGGYQFYSGDLSVSLRLVQ